MQLTITTAGQQNAQDFGNSQILFEPAYFVLGSGFGYTPTPAQTSLQGAALFTGSFTGSRAVVSKTQSQFMVLVPASSGPYNWGEIGVFSSNGILMAVGVFPTTHIKTVGSNLYLQIEWGESPGIQDTSTTSLAIGTGSHTLTVSADKTYYATESIKLYSIADDSKFMIGTITSYSGTTLVINVTSVSGSGTVASWGICNTIELIFENFLLNRILFLYSYAFTPKFSTAPTNNYIAVPPDSTPIYGGGYGNDYGNSYSQNYVVGASIQDHSDVILKGASDWGYSRYPFIDKAACTVASSINGYGNGYGYSYGNTTS